MINMPTIPGLMLHDPATQAELQATEAELKITIPNQYRDLLLVSNGFSIYGTILIYGAKECVERNRTWEVSTYAPGFLAIGDTGGGEVLLLQTDTDNSTLWVVGAGVMTPDEMRKVAPSMGQWFLNNCKLPEDD